MQLENLNSKNSSLQEHRMESLRKIPFEKWIDAHWSEVCSEPCQTSKMESFTKTVKDFQLITMVARHPMLDV